MQECNQYNENGQRHGYWEDYWYQGQLWFKGYYVNGKLDGYWEEYHHNGQLWFKGNFINCEQVGYWITSNNEYYYARM